MYEKTYTDLELIVLRDLARRRQTCGNYRYLVHEKAWSHTAFRSREALRIWMKERGLKLGKRYAYGTGWKIEGCYTEAMHMLDKTDLLKWFIENRINIIGNSVTLSNGDYTDSWIEDRNGHRVIHSVNPNCKRSVYDHRKMASVYCGTW